MRAILGGNGIGWGLGRTVKRSAGLLPNQVSGLTGWWDASALTGLSENDPCSTLPNLQGTAGRDFTSSSTARPTYHANVKNGLSVLRFDGSNDYMAAGGTPATYLKSDGTAGTMLVVCNPTSITLSNSNPWGNHGILAGSADYFGLYAKSGSPATVVAYTWLSGIRSVSANLPGANNWVVIGFRLNGTTMKVSVNGGAESSGTSDGINVASGLSGQFRMGAGGSQFFVGDVGEAPVYNVYVGDSDYAGLIAGLKSKWAIS